MSSYVLPTLKEYENIDLSHFPTIMQCFVFRNWEFICTDKLAEILETTAENIQELAYDMGLPPQKDVSVWRERGYITVIKQNWHILPYEQLTKLLDIDPEQLAYILKEDDFLSVKLGEKPACPPIKYRELSDNEKKQTAELAKTVREIFRPHERKAFDFFKKNFATPQASFDYSATVLRDNTGFSHSKLFFARFVREMKDMWGEKFSICNYKFTLEKDAENTRPEYHSIKISDNNITVCAADEAGILRAFHRISDMTKQHGAPILRNGTFEFSPRFETRMIYSYHGLYGNVFDADIELSYSDSLLEEYSKAGVNAIWTQGILYKLVELPFAPEISSGWQKRIENLNKLIKKAAGYGIKVYLYLNEPRSLPTKVFDKYPNLRGVTQGEFSAMCTSVPQNIEYLHDAVYKLCKSAPGLGGFFTITMSENLTNCHSRVFGGKCTCVRCVDRTPADIAAQINNTIYDAMKSAENSANLYAWTWGWKATNGFSDEECIAKMHPDIRIMNCSEEDMPFEIAGFSGNVIDYTMSLPAPGERAISIWNTAKKHGKQTAAKIQINNTWECSTVPYIPVFGLITEHMEKLCNHGVKHLMLSWTLGGAPSPNIKIASQYFFESNTEQNNIFESLYGKYAETVKKASVYFDKAFREFPFSVQVAYFGPQFTGPANLLFRCKTGETATMTGFPYDDLASWCCPYSADALEDQFLKLSDIWREGLDILCGMPNCEFTDIACACYDIFRSCYNQIRFIRLRDSGNRSGVADILNEEEQLAKDLYEIALRQPTVGYEAANHYVFTPGMCLEKVLNCRNLKKLFGYSD